MKKVLLAVDETKGSKAALNTFLDLFSCMRPDTVILLNSASSLQDTNPPTPALTNFSSPKLPTSISA